MRTRSGNITMEVIVFGGVAVIVISGFVLWTYSALNFSLRGLNRAAAFSIAESGIEYYRWHLAHDQNDFTDGTGGPGPYLHSYYDRNGTLVGSFSLTITPPQTGSTIVTVESAGHVVGDATIEKIIRVKF